MVCYQLLLLVVFTDIRRPQLTLSNIYVIRFNRCVSARKKFFILGDLNDDLLAPGSKLSKIIKNNKLAQIIDKPSRITNTTATLLDVIITNTPDIVISHDVVPNTVGDYELIT